MVGVLLFKDSPRAILTLRVSVQTCLPYKFMHMLVVAIQHICTEASEISVYIPVAQLEHVGSHLSGSASDHVLQMGTKHQYPHAGRCACAWCMGRPIVLNLYDSDSASLRAYPYFRL